jgi:hypothetical protein
MNRQILTDGTGQWIDRDTLTAYAEATWWDGNNRVSLATNSQWEHECLYRTLGGQWVLHGWSQWGGIADTWQLVEDSVAAIWLSTNGHTSCDVSETDEAIAALEVK